MREETSDTSGPTKHDSLVQCGLDEDGQTHSRSSDSPYSSPQSGQKSQWTKAESGQASNARQVGNHHHHQDQHLHHPNADAFELKSSRPTVLPTGNRIDAPTAEEKRSTPSPLQQERQPSQAPRRPSDSRTSCRDLEKAPVGRQSPRSRHSNFSSSHQATTVYQIYDETDDEEDPKQHAMWILIYLSALAPLLSILTCLYAFTATIAVLVLSPLCLCMTAHPLKANFRRFLAPPLSFQLGLIYSDFDPDEDEHAGQNSAMLVLVNILSPVYAVGICLAAWVAAGFWFFAAILGDPNLKNNNNNINKNAADKDDDGRTTVMSVRRWWETWLISGLR